MCRSHSRFRPLWLWVYIRIRTLKERAGATRFSIPRADMRFVIAGIYKQYSVFARTLERQGV